MGENPEIYGVMTTLYGQTHMYPVNDTDQRFITMTSYWARWRLKSPASRLFTQPFFQGADQRKHQSSASLAFVRGIHRWAVNSPLKWPVTRKMFLNLVTSSCCNLIGVWTAVLLRLAVKFERGFKIVILILVASRVHANLRQDVRPLSQ